MNEKEKMSEEQESEEREERKERMRDTEVRGEYGTCQFCQQQRIVYPLREETQEELDRMATEACQCERAQNARKQASAHARIMAYIAVLMDEIKRKDWFSAQEIAMGALETLETMLLNVVDMLEISMGTLQSVNIKIKDIAIRVSKSGTAISFKVSEKKDQTVKF